MKEGRTTVSGGHCRFYTKTGQFLKIEGPGRYFDILGVQVLHAFPSSVRFLPPPAVDFSARFTP